MLSWPSPSQVQFQNGDKSLQRTLTLVGCALAALAGGTNYVFSAYAPQLGARLNINHTQLNTIALAGNVGVYSTGPLWGSIVDARGPRILYLVAIVLLFTGYFGIKLFYDGVLNLPSGPHKTASLAFALLILCAFLSGAGGNSGLSASVNATAKSFSDRRRSSAVGIVVSGFGLSAFFFSTLAHTAFSDDTSAFLTVLALGTTVPMIIAFLIVRIVPVDEADEEASSEAGYVVLEQDSSGGPGALERRLNQLEDEREFSTPRPSTLNRSLSTGSRIRSGRPGLHRSLSPASRSLEPAEFGSIISPPTHARRSLDLEEIEEDGPAGDQGVGPSIHHGVTKAVQKELLSTDSFAGLLSSSDFWLMFFIVSLLSGTGLMWINNVGSVAQALVAQGNPDSWDRAKAARLQAQQVSIVSVMNCLGRIAIGIVADFAKHRYSIRRVTFLVPISALFILSQLLAAHTTSPSSLYRSSALLGTAYGAMFSLAPLIILEWFGMERFSRNWGTVAISPVLGGNAFSLMFGRTLDRHAAETDAGARSAVILRAIGGIPDLNSDHQCFEGLACYVESLNVTIFACVIALLLSVGAAWRDKKTYAVRDQLAVESRQATTGANTPAAGEQERESLLRS